LILATTTEQPIEVRSLDCNQQQGASRKKRNAEDSSKLNETGAHKIKKKLDWVACCKTTLVYVYPA